MREFKFRAWSDETKMMYHSHRPNGTNNPMWSYDSVFRANNPKTHIMQYTGFTDKNGKEIYDGDIAKYMQYKTPIVIIWDWKFAAFDFYHVGDEGARHILSPRIASESIEVIGNIYENPELLEEVMT